MQHRVFLRFLRAVVATAVAAALAEAAQQIPALSEAIPVLLRPIVVPALTGAIMALGKWLREKYGIEVTP